MLRNNNIDYVISTANEIDFFTEKKSSKSFSDAFDKGEVAIRSFFEKLKAAAKKFIADMNMTIKRLSLPAKLRMIEQQIKSGEKKGYEYVNMIDYREFQKLYHTYSKPIMNEIKTFDFRKFKSKEKLEKKMDEIDELIEEYQYNLDHVLSHPKKTRINDALSWVEEEIHGESSLWKDYIRMMNDLEHILINYEELTRKAEVMTPQWLKGNHKNWLGRKAQNFASVTRSKIAKCTRVVVFTFA